MTSSPDSFALIQAADARRRAGRMDDAIALLEAATRAAPNSVEAWSALAQTLAAANRPDLALPAWERATALAVDPAAALAGKGRALQALARPAEAAAAFRAALETSPTSAEARYGLALLAFEAGDYDGAAAQATHLPEAPATSWLSARIALARGAFDEAWQTLERQLARGGLDKAARADAQLLLGETLDRLGRPSEAFAAAMAGKAMQRALFAPRAAGREGEVARLRRLAAWFAQSPQWDAGDAPSTDERRPHVFLVGFARSGTTLLEQALAAHSGIVTLEEAPTLAEARRALMSDADGLARLARLDAQKAAHWRSAYWQVVAEHGVAPEGRLFLDKAPAGASDLPLIARLFPEARVLFAVRDPRDVVLSCAMNAFQMNALTYAFTDLGETAACYDAAMTLAGLYRERLPGLAILDVRHEALVEDAPAVLRGVADFIGVDFEESMADLAGAASGRTVRTPSGTQVRGGLDRRGLARWRGYAAELAPVMSTLAPWAKAFGYPER